MSDKNDLLRRQDCIEAIEGIACSMSLCVNADECHGMKRMQKQAVIELANMPAVQPEIIRCKDCRFNDGTAYCVFHFRDVKGEGYCSWGERRTDG